MPPSMIVRKSGQKTRFMGIVAQRKFAILLGQKETLPSFKI